MRRVASLQIMLPRATSNLALNASRDEASTTSLGNLFQVHAVKSTLMGDSIKFFTIPEQCRCILCNIINTVWFTVWITFVWFTTLNQASMLNWPFSAAVSIMCNTWDLLQEHLASSEKEEVPHWGVEKWRKHHWVSKAEEQTKLSIPWKISFCVLCSLCCFFCSPKQIFLSTLKEVII